MRHAPAYVLALAAAAVPAGASSLSAVGEWVSDVPASVLLALGGAWTY
ncbi:hypothetical protein ACH4SK_17150 [Streptomyces inhibens]